MTAVAAERPVPGSDQLERWISERELQRAAFLERCTAWAVGRGDLVLSWPADEAAVVALGVPCDDCVTVVESLEARGSRSRHVLQVTARMGEHWARGIVAKCGRPPRWPA